MFRRGLIGYLPVNVVQAIAGFGAIVVFTRLLSATAYGDYALAFSVTSLVHTALFTWSEAAVARFYAAEPGARGRADLLATLYRSSALLTAAVPLAAALILTLAPISAALKLAICAGLASAMARTFLKIAQERRRAAGEVRGFAVYDIAQTGGGFLIGVTLAALGLGGAAPLLGLGLASLVCLMFAARGELALARPGRFEPARLKRYAAYGLPVSLSLLMSLALSTTDRFVLAAYMDQAAVGAYHAGYTLANRTLDVLFIWFGMAAAPAAVAAFERGGAAALDKLARQQASLMLLVSVPAATGLALVAAPLSQLMVGPDLAAAAGRVTPWIALSALFAGVNTYYLATAFTLSRRTGRLFIAIAIPAVANLALTLLLIPRFGLDGAVWATTASFALGAVASYALGRSVLALPIPWSDLARVALASGAMAAAVLALPSPGGLPELLLKAGAGALVYAACAFALDTAGVRSRSGSLLRTLKPSPAA